MSNPGLQHPGKEKVKAVNTNIKTHEELESLDDNFERVCHLWSQWFWDKPRMVVRTAEL